MLFIFTLLRVPSRSMATVLKRRRTIRLRRMRGLPRFKMTPARRRVIEELLRDAPAVDTDRLRSRLK